MRLRKIKRTALICAMAGGILAGIYQDSMVLKVYAEEYEYDELNRVTKVIYDDGSYVEYIYDSNGNIIETIVSSNLSEDSSDEQDSSETANGSDNPTESSNPLESSSPAEPPSSSESSNPTGSSKPAGPSRQEQSTDSPGQAESVKQTVEDFTNLVRQMIYLENLVQKITKFAQNSFYELEKLS